MKTDVKNHVLVISSLYDSNYWCEQLFSLMKEIKSRTRMHLTNEHLVGCMQITTEIKPDVERFHQAKAVSNISLITDSAEEKY
jgi:hypothetical protein